MGRYMSKAEKAKMEADLKKRKEASTRRAAQRHRTEVGKASLAARGQKPATKRYDQMTAAEKAAYRAKTGRTQSLKNAKAAGDTFRKKRAAAAATGTSTSTPKPKPVVKPTPQNTSRPGGDRGYKETPKGNAGSAAKRRAAAEAEAAYWNHPKYDD